MSAQTEADYPVSYRRMTKTQLLGQVLLADQAVADQRTHLTSVRDELADVMIALDELVRSLRRSWWLRRLPLVGQLATLYERLRDVTVELYR